MGHVVQSIHIDAPPERVFDLAVDGARIPEYMTWVSEVKDVSGPLDRIGASYTAVMKIAGRRLEGQWEVVRVEKPTFLELRGTAPGGGRASFTYRNEPKDGGTDRTVELDYELPAGFVGEMVDKLFVEKSIERDARHSMENMKEICEARVPATV